MGFAIISDVFIFFRRNKTQHQRHFLQQYGQE